MKFTVIGEGTAEVSYRAECPCGWVRQSWSPSEVVKAYDSHAAMCSEAEVEAPC